MHRYKINELTKRDREREREKEGKMKKNQDVRTFGMNDWRLTENDSCFFYGIHLLAISVENCKVNRTSVPPLNHPTTMTATVKTIMMVIIMMSMMMILWYVVIWISLPIGYIVGYRVMVCCCCCWYWFSFVVCMATCKRNNHILCTFGKIAWVARWEEEEEVRPSNNWQHESFKTQYIDSKKKCEPHKRAVNEKNKNIKQKGKQKAWGQKGKQYTWEQ